MTGSVVARTSGRGRNASTRARGPDAGPGNGGRVADEPIAVDDSDPEIRAAELDQAGVVQGQQFGQPTGRRPAGQEREEAVEFALHEPDPVDGADHAGGQGDGQHSVDRQQGVENRGVGREVRVGAPAQVRPDVVDNGCR